MDFAWGADDVAWQERVGAFLEEHVYPAEPVYAPQRAARVASGRPHDVSAVVDSLKEQARSRGLWNLFLPAVSGLSNLSYAPLAELMGRSVAIAPESMNCSA